MGEELVKHAFTTSPDTVYAVFVAALLAGLGGLLWFIKKIYNDFQAMLEENRRRAEERDKLHDEARDSYVKALQEATSAHMGDLRDTIQKNTSVLESLRAELRKHRGHDPHTSGA